jgi:uncharacterized membrane protein
MSQLLVALATLLHNLATVIFIGYYVVLALICLPALLENPENARGPLISGISKHSRTWLYVALVIFAPSGVYLTLVDPNYLGLANFGNVWGVLMLVKHTVIVGMVVAAFWFNAILRVGPLASSNTGAAQAIARFRTYVNSMAVCGVVVLLLTAIAQGQ